MLAIAPACIKAKVILSILIIACYVYPHINCFSLFRRTPLPLNEKHQEIFDWLVFEVAGMREETLVNHPDRTEAMLMNIRVEMVMWLGKPGTEQKINCKSG